MLALRMSHQSLLAGHLLATTVLRSATYLYRKQPLHLANLGINIIMMLMSRTPSLLAAQQPQQCIKQAPLCQRCLPVESLLQNCQQQPQLEALRGETYGAG